MIDYVQGWVDAASRADGAGRRAQEKANMALIAIGKHLRYDHGYSRRSVARKLGMRERWVRDVVEDTDG